MAARLQPAPLPFGLGQHPTRRIRHENSTGTAGRI